MATLTIDVGNTRTKCALCEPAEPLPVCLDVVEVRNTSATDILQAIASLTASGFDRAIISGSNSRLRDDLLSCWEPSIPIPKVLADSTEVGIKVNLATPQTTGLDRLLNVRGAMCLWPDSAVIIIDAGTATTVDLVTEDTFQGGAILPGLALSAKALHDHTDALPLIKTDNLEPNSMDPVGRSTTEAIQAGVLLGHVGAIRELVTRVILRHPDATVVLTGGSRSQLATSFPEAQVEPWLGIRAMASLVPGSTQGSVR